MLNKKIAAQILDGSLMNKETGLTGMYRGYYISILTVQTVYTIQISASATTEFENNELGQFLEHHKQMNKPIQNYKIYDHKIELHITAPVLIKKLPAHLNDIINPIINYLASNGYVSGCENCGTVNEQPGCYEINGTYHYLCQACAGNIGTSLQMNQQNVKAQKSNMVGGLVGAFLGALIGCVVWVLIYRLGYIAGLAGAITAICAFKGYEMLGKHLDIKGVIGSLIIALIMIFFANKVAWSWEIYDAFVGYYDITFFDAFLAAEEIIAENDLTAAYYGELLIGYLLTLVASYKNIIAAFKSSTGSFTMNKLK